MQHFETIVNQKGWSCNRQCNVKDTKKTKLKQHTLSIYFTTYISMDLWKKQ